MRSVVAVGAVDSNWVDASQIVSVAHSRSYSSDWASARVWYCADVQVVTAAQTRAEAADAGREMNASPEMQSAQENPAGHAEHVLSCSPKQPAER